MILPSFVVEASESSANVQAPSGRLIMGNNPSSMVRVSTTLRCGWFARKDGIFTASEEN